MRGALGLEARLLLRPAGIAGLIALVSAGVAAAGGYLAWYEVTANVELLGSRTSGSVASLAGWEAQPWGWLVPALGIAAMVLAAGLAVDRPVSFGRDGLLLSGFGIAMLVAIGALLFPPVDRFIASEQLREMLGLADKMPVDSALSFQVAPGPGMWVTLAGAAMLVAATIAARELP
ncbi:MAG: hypothetical protein R3249_02345 [Nitriliruptorales bacterium]|nr:hypothetical protein [Nitriliruptorales bacterium]